MVPHRGQIWDLFQSSCATPWPHCLPSYLVAEAVASGKHFPVSCHLRYQAVWFSTVCSGRSWAGYCLACWQCCGPSERRRSPEHEPWVMMEAPLCQREKESFYIHSLLGCHLLSRNNYLLWVKSWWGGLAETCPCPERNQSLSLRCSPVGEHSDDVTKKRHKCTPACYRIVIVSTHTDIPAWVWAWACPSACRVLLHSSDILTGLHNSLISSSTGTWQDSRWEWVKENSLLVTNTLVKSG